MLAATVGRGIRRRIIPGVPCIRDDREANSATFAACMDSISQFALGASVAAVVLGPRVGAARAVLLGGLVATLPDLDVLIDHGDRAKLQRRGKRAVVMRR